MPNHDEVIRTLLDEHYALVEEIALRRAVLFVGAGLSIPAGLPGWYQLMQGLRERLALDIPEPSGDLLDYAERLDRRVGRWALGRALRDMLTTHKGPTEVQRALMGLPFDAVLTTNFDHLLEEALDGLKKRYDPIRYDEEVGVLDPLTALPVVKFHGDINDPPGIVLTRSDYDAYTGRHPAFRPLFEALLATRTFFFVGFGLRDPNFLALDGSVQRAVGKYRRCAYSMTLLRPGKRLPRPATGYRFVGVPAPAADDFLLALAEEVQAAVSRESRTEALGEVIRQAARAVAKAVDALDPRLTEPPNRSPFSPPKLPEGAAKLRPHVFRILESATAVEAVDDEVWRKLGHALFHLREYGAALRAVGRLPVDDTDAALTEARCHWYRDELWRTRRVLERQIYRCPDSAPDIAFMNRYPSAVAMYAYSSNLVAEQHLARKRTDRAVEVAKNVLRAVAVWLDDDNATVKFPLWLFKYVHAHRGRAYTLLIGAGESPKVYRPLAEQAFERVVGRSPKFAMGWRYYLDLLTICGDGPALEGLRSRILRRGGRRLIGRVGAASLSL